MRAVGLITEYNPLHNGHLQHLRESKRVSGAEVTVAVMSGHFLQRGEPALVDKWVRTEMALRAGVDVVVELPFPWACNSAPHFARGGVAALEALGRIDALCFGSEAGDLETLQHCADLLHEREEDIARGSEELLRKGISYPEARARVFARLSGDPAQVATLATPNNILGIEYLRALRQADSALQPFTIRRVGAGFHEVAVAEGEIASATGIRRLLQEGRDIAPFLPAAVSAPLFEALALRRNAHGDLHLRLLLNRIYRDASCLQRLYLVDDGIENRLAAVADEAVDFDNLVTAVKSRQLTRTRIQRMLAHILLGVERSDMEAMLASGPLYLHLLGAGARGRQFLATCRKHLALPLVQNFSRIHALLKRRYGAGSRLLQLALRQVELETRATRHYTLLLPGWSGGSRNRDFFEEFRTGER